MLVISRRLVLQVLSLREVLMMRREKRVGGSRGLVYYCLSKRWLCAFRAII